MKTPRTVNYKLHESEQMKILAICDSDLIGKKLEGNTINEAFYGKESIPISIELIEKLRSIIDNMTAINILGPDALNIMINVLRLSIDDLKRIKQKIVYLDKVPHLQIYDLKKDETKKR